MRIQLLEEKGCRVPTRNQASPKPKGVKHASNNRNNDGHPAIPGAAGCSRAHSDRHVAVGLDCYDTPTLRSQAPQCNLNRVHAAMDISPWAARGAHRSSSSPRPSSPSPASAPRSPSWIPSASRRRRSALPTALLRRRRPSARVLS